jgi:hypothetical protein
MNQNLSLSKLDHSLNINCDRARLIYAAPYSPYQGGWVTLGGGRIQSEAKAKSYAEQLNKLTKKLENAKNV